MPGQQQGAGPFPYVRQVRFAGLLKVTGCSRTGCYSVLHERGSGLWAVEGSCVSPGSKACAQFAPGSTQRFAAFPKSQS